MVSKHSSCRRAALHHGSLWKRLAHGLRFPGAEAASPCALCQDQDGWGRAGSGERGQAGRGLGVRAPGGGGGSRGAGGSQRPPCAAPQSPAPKQRGFLPAGFFSIQASLIYCCRGRASGRSGDLLETSPSSLLHFRIGPWGSRFGSQREHALPPGLPTGGPTLSTRLPARGSYLCFLHTFVFAS